MIPAQPKKMLIINILDILKKYSDEEHRLSQKDIIDILHKDYQMTADRKSVKRNLMNLIDYGYEINYSEALRMAPTKDGGQEETYILSDFYLERDFTDSELRLLIDSLAFSKHIPNKQCKELTEKLAGLSNQYFRARVKYIRTLPDNAPQNGQLFYTIDVIDEAIAERRQISFHYNYFGTDKKLHPAKNPDGTVKTYVVNPYQMAAANGRYYLICNYDNHNNAANIRVDRITDIKLLDMPAKSHRKIPELQGGLNLPKHMAEHLYMFAGAGVPVTFRVSKRILSDVIDWFGKDISFFDESEDEISVRVTVNREAMRCWALQYCRFVRVLTPADLRDTVRNDLQAAADGYR